jgi:glutamate racemase
LSGKEGSGDRAHRRDFAQADAVLRAKVQDYLGEDVVIIDPSVECTEHIRDYLTAEDKLNRNNYPERIYLVTDNPELFRSSGERYLDRKIHQVSLVDIGELERIG